MKDGVPVSIAELIVAGARPLPGEAVAILLDVCEQVVRQPAGGAVLPAITPSALFVDASGTVALAGGVPVEDDQTVQLLGRLLLQMLPSPGAAGSHRVPSRLSDLASRAAAGELPRVSVERLAASLRRFAPEQPRAAVRALFDRWRSGAATSSANVPGRRGAASNLGADSSLPRHAHEMVGPLQAERAATSSRGLRRRVGGAILGTLLILAGAGAYWLSADTKLPPVPLSPTLLSQPPAPPRGGWELLDPTPLAVDAYGVRSVAGPPADQHAQAQSQEPRVAHRPEQ
jgi:hypothetical protein